MGGHVLPEGARRRLPVRLLRVRLLAQVGRVVVADEAQVSEAERSVSSGGNVPCQTAQLLVDGREHALSIEPYEPVWSCEMNAYDGPVSDCYLLLDNLEDAYYRVISDSAQRVTLLPADLLEATFGDDLPSLQQALTAYCQENLPAVTELTYTGEALIDDETNAASHLFACKEMKGALLTVAVGAASTQYAIEGL